MSEGKLFACPSCGASLSLEGVAGADTKCPYCGSQVVVPAELRPPEPAHTAPINIVVNDGATSIQVNDLSAFQPPPVNVAFSNPMLAEAAPLASAQTARWIKIGIWAFVAFIALTFVIPILCSVCGMALGIGGSFLPLFIK